MSIPFSDEMKTRMGVSYAFTAGSGPEHVYLAAVPFSPAVVFGNRCATLQFEGYAQSKADSCDMLSMHGLRGLAESRHPKAATSCSGRGFRRVREL